jgi:transposase
MVNFKDVKKGDYLEMAAYSIDLRQKILSAWQNKEGTQRELAKRFKVSLSFLRDFLRRYRETGQIAARVLLRDRRSKLKGKEEELLIVLHSQYT